MTDNTFDLTALSQRLFTEDRLKPLAGMINRAQDLASMRADLEIALESLDTLAALFAAPQSDDLSTSVTEYALLSNAVLLYARATKTTSVERRSFDLSSRFSEQEKIMHQELVDLRDGAIAHFGSGGSYQGLWHVEAVILQTNIESSRVGVLTRRQTRDVELVKRARTQIAKAHSLIDQICIEKIEKVTAELNKMNPDDFEKEIRQHLLDLDVMMASQEAANLVRSSANNGGYSKGIVKHRG